MLESMLEWAAVRLAYGTLRRRRRAGPSEELENQQVRGVEAGHCDVIQVFIALSDVAADQNTQLFHGDP
jgi:hypothetical protein